ncbi:rifin PIR protein, putative [Plasmodium reichenowi]|uniref:Rifin PIR protein, putative n=1 Tax=Plasmodium reichenowi TaxID=5854 RepID=A0A2P9DEA3_PLARE|nr:rifin PIR protein, putative [Plasmodium reichenowi]
MKVHYINILLFAHALNILVNTHKKTSITQKISTTRSLCECELYAPANYDNDKEMKKVMQQFEDRTSQRFHEYDERLKTIRQKCKDRCDKESQKIILKDKLEKQMAEQFATLQTDIQSDAIPTCVCEKSMADKVEKGCLRCGGVLGGGVAPSVWLFGTFAVDKLTSALTAAAIAAAKQAGIEAGVQAVIAEVKGGNSIFSIALQGVDWSKYINGSNYNIASGLVKAVKNAATSIGKGCSPPPGDPFVCRSLSVDQPLFLKAVKAGRQAYTQNFAAVKAAKKGGIEAASTELYATVGYSVLAIIIIILIMVIIYLILRHRRKKKMKKKLQYIKLLEE